MNKQMEALTQQQYNSLIQKYPNGILKFDDLLNYFKQPEKMNQIMTLDLNVLDLCTIDQLSEVEALIAKIKNTKMINHNQAKKEEKKQAHKKEIENKRKFYDAVQERINQQEKWLQNQRLLLVKISDDYQQLKKEYNNEFQQGINKTI